MSNSFRSLLPPNVTKTERSLERVMARPDTLPVKIRDLWSPDACPLHLLPWLAWAYGVTKWDSRWAEDQKRAVVRNALFVRRYKGTYAAVERALSSLGYNINIVEWYEDSPRGEPATFRIDISISDVGIDEPMYTEMTAVINDAKNLRSHLSGMRLVMRSDALLRIGSALCIGEQINVDCMSDPDLVTQANAVFRTGTLQEINIFSRP